MPELSERIRDLVDGAERAVTVADVESVLQARTGPTRVVSGRMSRGRTGALATAAAAAVAVGVLVLWSQSPARVTVAASTPVVLEVPSSPTLMIKIPSDAIHGYKISWSKVPAYVPLPAGGALMGYVTTAGLQRPPLIAAPAMSIHPPFPGVRSCYLVPSDSAQVVNVFNGSHALIGRIYPNTGFGRLGDQPACN